jgi:hypothetical protein
MTALMALCSLLALVAYLLVARPTECVEYGRRTQSGDARLNVTLILTDCCSRMVRKAAYLGNVDLSMFPFSTAFMIGFAWAVNV